MSIFVVAPSVRPIMDAPTSAPAEVTSSSTNLLIAVKDHAIDHHGVACRREVDAHWHAHSDPRPLNTIRTRQSYCGVGCGEAAGLGFASFVFLRSRVCV